MRVILGIVLAVCVANVFLVDAMVSAQAPIAQPTVAPDVQQLLGQLHQVGCNAEETAAAQTIAALKKENDSLKAEIQKLDPPKSGATKH
jgi:cell division protein FtsB